MNNFGVNMMIIEISTTPLFPQLFVSSSLKSNFNTWNQ